MSEPVEDLSIRARSSRFTENERRKLESLLKGSFEARLAHRAGSEFDAEDVVRPGDDKIADRIVRSVYAEFPKQSRRRSRLILLAIVVALSAGSAAAAGAAGFRYFEWVNSR